jgi:hypothetical protein
MFQNFVETKNKIIVVLDELVPTTTREAIEDINIRSIGM